MNRLVAPQIQIESASSRSSRSQQTNQEAIEPARTASMRKIEMDQSKQDDMVESAYRRQNTVLEMNINVDSDSPQIKSLQQQTSPSMKDIHQEEIMGLDNRAVGGKYLSQQMTIQNRSYMGHNQQFNLKQNTNIGMTNNRMVYINPNQTKHALNIHKPALIKKRNSDDMSESSFVQESVIGSFVMKHMMNNNNSSMLGPALTDKQSSPATLNMSRLSTIKMEPDLEHQLAVQTPLGQFQDSSLLRTVSTIEQMKQQPTHKNIIMERNEMDERDERDKESNVEEYLLQLPSQVDERQQNQRMKSIIVQKVTKMYTASQDPMTNSYHNSDSEKKPFRGQKIYDQNWKLNQCHQALEFIIMGYCKSFDFDNPLQAAHFVAEYDVQNEDGSTYQTSQYIICLQQMENFQKINNFLSLLQTNLKHLIHLLEQENDVSFYHVKSQQDPPNASSDRLDQELDSKNRQSHSTERLDPATSSLHIIMNLLTLGLSKSVDDRIVWQTCILMSGFFQFVSGISVNQGFSQLVIQWALNRDVNDNQLPIDRVLQTDFISRCLQSRHDHESVNNPIMKLFFEVANLSRLKKSQQKQSCLILHDLLSTIIPQYFRKDEEHNYLELIEDTISSHLFQYEKDRIDKQYLLFVQTDRCFQKILGYINESKRQGSQTSMLNQLLLDGSSHYYDHSPNSTNHMSYSNTNTQIQTFNILLSIWSTNSTMLQYTVSQYLQAFQNLAKTIKLECRSNIEPLLFGYEKFGNDTTIEQIAMRLVQKGIKKSSKLVRVATIFKVQALAEYFQKNQETKKEEFIVQLLYQTLFDEKCNLIEVDDEPLFYNDHGLTWRLAIYQYLQNYFISNQTTDLVNSFVEEYTEYLQQCLQGNLQIEWTYTEEFQIFNQHELFKSLINHSKLSNESAIALFDLFSQIIFMEEFTDYFSKRSACILIQQLYKVSEVELIQHWMSMIKYTCMELTKIEYVILQKQVEGIDSRELQLQRHVIFKSIEGIIKSSQESHKDQGTILNFCKFFLCSLSELERTPKTIIKLSNILLSQTKIQDQKVISIKKATEGLLPQRTILGGVNIQNRKILDLGNEKQNEKIDQRVPNHKLQTATKNNNKSRQLNKDLRMVQDGSGNDLNKIAERSKQKRQSVLVTKDQGFGDKVAEYEMNLKIVQPSEKESDGYTPKVGKTNMKPLNIQAIKRNDLKYKGKIRTSRSNGNHNNKDDEQNDSQQALSTLRLAKCNDETRQKQFESDLLGQSFGTTLRTEIYSSEDEYEMVNYYAFLSDYKKGVNNMAGTYEMHKDLVNMNDDDCPLTYKIKASVNDETPNRDYSLSRLTPPCAEIECEMLNKGLRTRISNRNLHNRTHSQYNDKASSYNHNKKSTKKTDEIKSMMQAFENEEIQSSKIRRRSEIGDRASEGQRSNLTDMPPIQRTKPPSVYQMNYQHSKLASNLVQSEAYLNLSSKQNDRSKTIICNDQDSIPQVKLPNQNQIYTYDEPKSADLPILLSNTYNLQKQENTSYLEQIDENQKLIKRQESQNSLFESWKKNKLQEGLSNPINESPREQPTGSNQNTDQVQRMSNPIDNTTALAVEQQQESQQSVNQIQETPNVMYVNERTNDMFVNQRPNGIFVNETPIRDNNLQNDLMSQNRELDLFTMGKQQASNYTASFNKNEAQSIRKIQSINNVRTTDHRIISRQIIEEQAETEGDNRPKLDLNLLEFNHESEMLRMVPPISNFSRRNAQSIKNQISSEMQSSNSRQVTQYQNQSASSQQQSVKTPMSFGMRNTKIKIEKVQVNTDGSSNQIDSNQRESNAVNDDFAHRTGNQVQIMNDRENTIQNGLSKKSGMKLRMSKNSDSEQRIDTLRKDSYGQQSPDQNFKSSSLPPILNNQRDSTVSTKPPIIPKKIKKTPKTNNGVTNNQSSTKSAPKLAKLNENGGYETAPRKQRKEKSELVLPSITPQAKSASQDKPRRQRLDNSVLISQNCRKRRKIRTIITSNLNGNINRDSQLTEAERQEKLQQSERQKRIAKYYGCFNEQKTHELKQIKKEHQPFSRQPVNNLQYAKRDIIILRNSEQVPDLSLKSSRGESNDWSMNLRQNYSQPELPQMKKIKIIKKVFNEKERDNNRNNYNVIKEKSKLKTPKSIQKNNNNLKQPTKDLGLRNIKKQNEFHTPQNQAKPSLKLQKSAKRNVSQEPTKGNFNKSQTPNLPQLPNQTPKIKIKTISKNQNTQPQNQKQKKNKQLQLNKQQNDLKMNIQIHESQMSDYKKVIGDLQQQIEKLKEENEKDKQMRFNSSNISAPQIQSRQSGSNNQSQTFSIPIQVIANRNNDEQLNDETHQPVNVVMDTVSSGQHRSPERHEELNNAPSRRRQHSSQIGQSHRVSQVAHVTSEHTVDQHIVSDIRHDNKKIQVQSLRSSLNNDNSRSNKFQNNQQIKEIILQDKQGINQGYPGANTQEQNINEQVNQQLNEQKQNVTNPIINQTKSANISEVPTGQSTGQVYQIQPSVDNKQILPNYVLQQSSQQQLMGQQTQNLQTTNSMSTLQNPPTSMSTLQNENNQIQNQPPTLGHVDQNQMQVMGSAINLNSQDQKAKVDAAMDMPSQMTTFSPPKSPPQIHLNSQGIQISTIQRQDQPSVESPQHEMIMLTQTGQQQNQVLGKATETVGTIQRTPVGEDSEFIRDSNATFAIGNTFGFGQVNAKDINNYIKHSTTFKEFLAWKEARKFQSNTDSNQKLQGLQASNEISNDQVLSSERKMFGGNRGQSQTKSNQNNIRYKSLQINRENIEERSDDFELYNADKYQNIKQTGPYNENFNKKVTISSGSSKIEDMRASFKGSIPSSMQIRSPVASIRVNELRSQNSGIKLGNDNKDFDGSGKPPPPGFKRQKSKFLQILDSKDEKREDAQKIYVRQLSNSAQKMKQEVQRGFQDSVQELRIDPQKINIMRQKSMQRIQYLKKQGTFQSNRSSQSGSRALDKMSQQPNSATNLKTRELNLDYALQQNSATPSNIFQKQLTQLTNKYVGQLKNSEIDDDSAENKASDPSMII